MSCADLPEWEQPPGSQQALASGCRCPVLDNSHGRGYHYDSECKRAVFIITEGCPLHDLSHAG